MSKLNIKWINVGNFNEGINTRRWSRVVKNEHVSINPGYYIIRSYYKYKSKHYDSLTWTPPIFDITYDGNSIIEQLVRDDVDILCLSNFLWNVQLNARVAAEIKKIKPSIRIIAGGPALNAHKIGPAQFFEKYPDFDYIVYGDGEDAFTSIVDSIIEKRPIDSSTVNVVTRDKIYPFRVFSDKTFWDMSVILDMKDEIAADVNQLYKRGLTDIWLYWELDRGCPYSCSFCDWSSGLHHKVKRRSKRWKEELEFIKTLPVELKFAGANFGLFKEDVEIAQYIKDHNINMNSIPFLAKMNKENVSKIWEIFALKNPHYIPMVSLQDINETILENIARPDVPWEKHKQYMAEFNKKFPGRGFVSEMVIGLPGQNLDTFMYMLTEMYDAGVKHSIGYPWILLPNAPANQQDYIDKHQLVFKQTWLPPVQFDDPAVVNKHITEEDLISLANKNLSSVYQANIIRSSCSADTYTIVMMLSIIWAASGLHSKDCHVPTVLKSKPVQDWFRFKSQQVVKNVFDNNYLAVWDPWKNKYASVETFYMEPHVANHIMWLYNKSLV